MLPPRMRERVVFSNRGIAQEIPRALNELGYSVDIVNFTNQTFRPSGEYDLFVGHGGTNFSRLADEIGRGVPAVYFSTGLHWRDSNVREATRLYEATLRTGKLFPAERAIHDDEDGATRRAVGIICLGNEEAAKSYRLFPNVVAIDNAAYPLGAAPGIERNWGDARHRFLFFSGGGNIHKGLDRLLEAFDGTELTLHVCQRIEPEFERAYATLLRDRPNIVVHGFVGMRTPHFRGLASQCAWNIHPTCAEGQPGSVLECMAHGLIPVMPDAANIDYEDCGVRLADCSVETLRSVARALTSMSTEECIRRSSAATASVARRYSPERFRESFKGAIQALLDRA